MRILVVEDDPFIARMISRGLSAQHYAVDVATDGELGQEMGSVNDYDLIILDVLLPKRNGFDVCRQLRAEGSLTPILILTSLMDESNVIEGLDCGGDDYLSKPFSFGVLLARVRSLLRRNSQQRTSEIRIGELVMDTAGRSVTYQGQRVDLTAKELMLLEYFMQNPHEVLTREMISEHVWDMNFDPQSNVVDSLVRRLRGKLHRPGRAAVIQTVRGIGYRITEN
jgi:DNA-binding response OmpR family regulator